MTNGISVVIVLELGVAGGRLPTPDQLYEATRKLQSWIDYGTAIESMEDALGSTAGVRMAKVLK